jgi:hypothetical protein
VPLARGWVRQIDTLDNPLFYNDSLTGTQYHDWLLANGVTWVALPDVPLDYSALAEARLLSAGQPYLEPVWHNGHWRVLKVADTPGLVTGPATVTALQPNRVTLNATSAGTVMLRVRYTSLWTVESGAACVRTADDGWTRVVVRRVELTASLLHRASDCDATVPPG